MELSIIPTSISAICALVSLCCLIYSNYIHNKDKHALVRPIFHSTFSGSSGFIITLGINIENSHCKIKDVNWISTSNQVYSKNIKVILRPPKHDHEKKQFNYCIDLDCTDCNKTNFHDLDFDGKIQLTYINIYEKEEVCELIVNFKSESYLNPNFFYFINRKKFFNKKSNKKT